MGYGKLGRIALAVLDSDYTIEPDMRRMLPEGVELHVGRVLYPHGVTESSLTVAVEGLGAAVDSLLPVRPSAVIWACTSASFLGGRAGNEQLVAMMRTHAAAVPVDTAAGAVVQALRAAGIRRPAVGSPYSPDINRRLAEFLRASGFEPVRIAELYKADVDDYTLQDVSTTQLVRFLTDVNTPDCDGLLLSCTGLPGFDVVPMVERNLDKPVISSNAAIAWWAMHLAKISASPRGQHRLFALSPRRSEV